MSEPVSAEEQAEAKRAYRLLFRLQLPYAFYDYPDGRTEMSCECGNRLLVRTGQRSWADKVVQHVQTHGKLLQQKKSGTDG